jgi:hypothetical protein
MIKKILPALIGAIIVLVGWGIFRLELLAEPTITVTLTAFPPSFNGTCYPAPTKVNFKGVIHVSAACAVQYMFVGSDGQKTPLTALNCPQAGDYKVVYDRTFSQNFSGWEVLRVARQQAVVESNRAGFSVICLPPITIDRADWQATYGGNPPFEVRVWGTNFGTAPGTKKLRVGSLSSFANVVGWSDGFAVFSGPTPVVPWTQTYDLVFTDGGQIISNSYKARFKYIIDRVDAVPAGGYVPGSTVTFKIIGLPAFQGGLTLVAKGSTQTYTLQIVSWQPPLVQVKLPTAPGFCCGIYIEDGGVDATQGGPGFCLAKMTSPVPSPKN